MTSNTFQNYQWKNLPLEILVEICSYLNIKDRKNVSSTCKSWYNAVHTPLLWRYFFFDLSSFGRCHSQLQRFTFVASNFGHCWLKGLEIFIDPSEDFEEHTIAFRFFVDFLKICVSEIVKRFLKKYSNLTELFLEWRYFGEKLLSSVANNCKNTLKYIHLTDVNDCNHKISVECWENVISLVPDLRTGFKIVPRGNFDLSLLKELLPRNLPIKDLDVRKNSIQPEFLQYYCQNFSNTLETLQLVSTDFDGLPVDDEILKLITSCSKLRSLFFIGKIKANTITTIIELRIQRVIGLELLSITMRNPTVKELENATFLSSYYENVIISENIPFKFSILCIGFSIDFDDEEESYSEFSTGEEEEEEDTESSSEEEEEEVIESSCEMEQNEVTESSSEDEEEDIESNIDDESDNENHI